MRLEVKDDKKYIYISLNVIFIIPDNEIWNSVMLFLAFVLLYIF